MRQPQRDHRIIDVATASGVVQPFTPARSTPRKKYEFLAT